ncbi:type VII secretion protein EsaA, partial [Microvirga sp. 3-52]|nr:type VII secretion protein EsaA [Microvirga sp. 3-52]
NEPRNYCCVAFVHYNPRKRRISGGKLEMKRIERKVLLFLVMVLVLSGGITYLALHQSTAGKADNEVLKMTVAIVNEDQGATFDGEAVDFGREFIKSIESDPTHDWYVVSRGVAENGFGNNAYNMMIVIPKDFSEKALSIEDEFPEKINLNYKINATGNKDVVAEAEKTAGAILGDFNRRIIDVYFASVIGNLQDAQKNIGTIVEKEAVYTSTYKKAVHSPLMQYTSQFENIQDNTQVSKDSFDGLKEILLAFEDALQDDVNSNEDYLTVFNDLSNMHELNTVSLKDFSNQLHSLDSGMHNHEL